MELICERMVWEEIIIVENTFVINNDNHKEVINIKDEKEIKVNKTYLISRDIPIVRHTHTLVDLSLIHILLLVI